MFGNMTEYGNVGHALINFLKYIMTSGAQSTASSVGYVPLPQSLLSKNLDVLNAIQLSSLSSGKSNNAPGFSYMAVLGVFLIVASITKHKKKGT